FWTFHTKKIYFTLIASLLRNLVRNLPLCWNRESSGIEKCYSILAFFKISIVSDKDPSNESESDLLCNSLHLRTPLYLLSASHTYPY
ncbi:LOW QUALITY PROTEIN: hypothetical protein MXB_4441, partial [Myxobolus squamalis]